MFYYLLPITYCYKKPDFFKKPGFCLAQSSQDLGFRNSFRLLGLSRIVSSSERGRFE